MNFKANNLTNLIFDLGGVIINVDIQRTLFAFATLLHCPPEKLVKTYLSSPLFYDYEKGIITNKEFKDGFCAQFKQKIPDKDFWKIWNLMLKDIPSERIDWLRQLKKKYHISLLSNTNFMHIEVINSMIKEHNYADTLEDLFDSVYFSYDLKMRKPNADIYQYVMKDLNSNPNATLFYDDIHENIEGAEKIAAINTVLVPHNQLTKNLLPI